MARLSSSLSVDLCQCYYSFGRGTDSSLIWTLFPSDTFPQDSFSRTFSPSSSSRIFPPSDNFPSVQESFYLYQSNDDLAAPRANQGWQKPKVFKKRFRFFSFYGFKFLGF